MTSHRTILMTLISLTVMSFATPSSALAGPLLGGYGGPGEGNQAILGSALLGGGGGNGSSGSSGGSSGSTGSSPEGVSGTGLQPGGSQSNASASGASAHGEVSRPGHQASGARSGGGRASGGAAHAYAISSDRADLQPTSGATETLGLSGTDLGYVLLVLCALVLTGMLTRRLAQPAGPQGTQ